MARKFVLIAAGCIAIGALMFGNAEESNARGIGGVGGVHIGGGGFGGGHFGGIQPFQSFGGGQLMAPRLGTPQSGGLGMRQFRMPSTAPRYGGLNAERFPGRAERGSRGFSTRYGSVRSGHIRGQNAGEANHLSRLARGQRGASSRTGQTNGLTAGDRGAAAGINTNRNAFTQFHERMARRGNPVQQRALAGQALARGVQPFEAMAARGPLNTAAFRRGNGFESQPFGGRLWRGREGRFRFFWAGGVFWPFLFGDYLSYAFWPDEYGEPFWAYGPSSILWGALWPYGGYGEETFAGEGGAQPAPGIGGQFGAPGSEQTAALCGGFAPGVTDLPVTQLEEIIKPTPEQRVALNELKGAVTRAAEVLRGSCSERAPVTPVARLDAMEQRLEAMQQAITIIRGPVERLYSLLSEEQVARLENAAAKTEKAGRSLAVNLTELCSAESGLTNVPADEIAKAITLTDEQHFDLDKLKQDAAKATDELRASCPREVPPAIEARLHDSYGRIAALIRAIETIRPAMASFYASLNDQQKAALNEHGLASLSARR